MKKKDLKSVLSQRMLVGDGAMSTYLYQLGIPASVPVEELTLSKPGWVREVHSRYYKAGARFIETNTFGANRERLSRYGLEGKVTRLNREAVFLAQQAVGEDAFIMGAVGSIHAGRVFRYSPAEYRDMFEEQVTAQLFAGVDGIILETFLDLEELVLALETIRPLTNQPILCQIAMSEVGRTQDGRTLSEAFQVLKETGADGVGLNCRFGPLELQRALEKTIIPEGMILSAFPNAGRLGITEGEYQYKSTPAYFGERAGILREQGLQIIGGCCGTTPEHIQAITSALKNLSPLPRMNPDLPVEEVQDRQLASTIRVTPTVVEKVKKSRTVIIEFDSPKDLDIKDYLKGAEKLHLAGADAITLADNSMATTRMSNMALGSIIKEKIGVEPLVHITCRDRNLIGQQSHLMGLHALRMDQILVITGDPTRIGDLPGSSSVYDVNSFDLIRMVKQLNQGISFSGRPLKQKAQFVVGAAFNPNVPNIETAVRRLEKKVDAGADFIMTQPIYDREAVQTVAEATWNIGVPVFIGVMPITSHRNALFLHNELPGVKVPDSVMKQIEGKRGAEARQIGVELAKNLLDEVMLHFNGIYLITPFSYWEMTAELTQYIRQAELISLTGER